MFLRVLRSYVATLSGVASGGGSIPHADVSSIVGGLVRGRGYAYLCHARFVWIEMQVSI